MLIFFLVLSSISTFTKFCFNDLYLIVAWLLTVLRASSWSTVVGKQVKSEIINEASSVISLAKSDPSADK